MATANNIHNPACRMRRLRRTIAAAAMAAVAIPAAGYVRQSDSAIYGHFVGGDATCPDVPVDASVVLGPYALRMASTNHITYADVLVGIDAGAFSTNIVRSAGIGAGALALAQDVANSVAIGTDEGRAWKGATGCVSIASGITFTNNAGCVAIGPHASAAFARANGGVSVGGRIAIAPNDGIVDTMNLYVGTVTDPESPCFYEDKANYSPGTLACGVLTVREPEEGSSGFREASLCFDGDDVVLQLSWNGAYTNIVLATIPR